MPRRNSDPPDYKLQRPLPYGYRPPPDPDPPPWTRAYNWYKHTIAYPLARWIGYQPVLPRSIRPGEARIIRDPITGRSRFETPEEIHRRLRGLPRERRED